MKKKNKGSDDEDANSPNQSSSSCDLSDSSKQELGTETSNALQSMEAPSSTGSSIEKSFSIAEQQAKPVINVPLILVIIALISAGYIAIIYVFLGKFRFLSIETLPIVAVISMGAIVIRNSTRPSKHSVRRILSFASSSAHDVLSSNWTHEEYYSRLYLYASPELAAHMQGNKRLLNRVLDERAELLGSFVQIEGLMIQYTKFQLLPSPVIEITGTLRCSKASVPIIILVNGAKDDLTLDGIKVNKQELKPLSQ